MAGPNGLLRRLWERLRPYLTLQALGVELEPARVRAFYASVVLAATSLGVAIPANLPAWVTSVLTAAAVLIPLLQGELTRAAVTPNEKVLARTDDEPEPEADPVIDPTPPEGPNLRAQPADI